MKDFNFFSPFIESHKSKDIKSHYLYIAAASILLLFIGFYIFNIFRINSYNSKINDLDNKLLTADVQQRLKNYQAATAQIKILSEYFSIVDDINTKLVKNDKLNTSLMARISNALPEKVFIKVMTVNKDSIQIQGISATRTAVAEFEHNLNNVNGILGVNVNTINAESDNNDSFIFTISCTLGAVNENEAK